MNTNKKHIRILVDIILIVVFGMLTTDNFRDIIYYSGAFDYVVLEKYIKRAEEERFNQVRIIRNDEETVHKLYKDQNKIDEIMSYFEDYYLVSNYKRIERIDAWYRISFENIYTHDSLNIEIINENHLEITFDIHKTKKERGKNIIHHDKDLTRKRYEIKNGAIDLEYIDKIIESMEDYR